MSGNARLISGFSPLQHTFPFVPEEQREQQHELYRSHFEEADRKAVKRAETTRKKLSLKVISGKTLPFESPAFRKLLDLPIGKHQASDLDVQPAPDDDAAIRVITHEDDEPIAWSDEAIAELHEALLHYSLQLLKSKGNAEEKHEILRWIWAPSVFCWTTRTVDGVQKVIPIYRRDLPFTFERCCAVVNCRAEEMRTGLAYVLRKFTSSVGYDFKELGIDIDS